MTIKRKRGFLEISFAWLFAIIAGVVILSLAIFFATKIINVGQYATSSQTQSQIGALLNPLETSFQASQVTSMTLQTQTRIYNECDQMNGIFGKQGISLSQLSLGRWSAKTQAITFQNKYIFSTGVVQGQQFFLFSKSFDFPFKISDLIYMTPSTTVYCFVNAPQNIQDELSNLNENNIVLKNDTLSCPGTSIKVCFSGSNCDVNVDYARGTVTKNSSSMAFYSDALMYGAIFSDKNVYECQLKRLMEREAQLSSLYIDKANIISQLGCNSNLGSDLLQLNSLTNSFNSSSQINNIATLANQVQQENSVSVCKLW